MWTWKHVIAKIVGMALLSVLCPPVFFAYMAYDVRKSEVAQGKAPLSGSM